MNCPNSSENPHIMTYKQLYRARIDDINWALSEVRMLVVKQEITFDKFHSLPSFFLTSTFPHNPLQPQQ
jgi:hypothetical protein